MTSRIDFTQPLHAGAPRLRHAFGTPREVLVASTLAQVRGVIDAVHAGAQRGHWCVGYVRYEAAAAFDTAVQTHAADGPLAWFAVYDAPLAWPGGVANHGDTDTGGAQVAWDDSLPRADFDAALAIQNATADQLREGSGATLRQLLAALERNKVLAINPAAGEKFDPHFHQAISVVPAAQEANTVVSVLQKGYSIADRTLRPALVTVAGAQ